MRVLVTGAGGTIGQVVAGRLRRSGWEVRAHDRAGSSDIDVTGDLRDPEHVEEILKGMDVVVHTAAVPNPVDGTESEIFANNTLSAYHVVDTAGRLGITRIVNVSSASALGFAWSHHGVSPTSVPVSEEHPYVGDDVYALSKKTAELTAATAARRWRTTIVSLRFPFVGSGERLRRHLDPIHADPGVDRRGLWAWLHTDDAAGAVEAAITAQLWGHQVITVTAPDTTALVPTADLLQAYHPATRIDRVPAGFGTVFAADRCIALLHFVPEHSWRKP